MKNVRKKAEAAVANAPPKPIEFPKRPPNAFLLFKSINKYKFKESDEPTNNINTFITKLWKSTPEEEKDIYREDAKRLMREFIEKNPTLYEEMCASIKAKGRSTRRSKLQKTTTQSGE
ncbi:hypothetical protein BD770DRAFT_378298 [Pilaira anomala]|nr:hypothetical protein BD770DRAFT_378298 [Pilaira anomala]